MISKMTRYDFLVFHADYEEFLLRLRDTGVLHIVTREEGIKETDELVARMQTKSRITRAIDHASALVTKEDHTARTGARYDAVLEAIARFEQQESNIAGTRARIDALTGLARQAAPWGRYSIDTINSLREAGITVDFYSTAVAKFNPEWPGVFPISNNGSTIFFAALNATEAIEADAVTLPDRDAAHIEAEIREAEAELARQQDELHSLATASVEDFRQALLVVDDEINFDNARLSAEDAAQGAIMLLEGYCPEENEDELQAMLAKSGVYYETHKPELTDNVPIKLKNNRFARLYEPIIRLYSLPNYSELDPTPFIAPFFMLFFGLCLGDAGYGAIILILATIAKFKMKKGRDMITLVQFLGASTLICGVLTGSMFGISLDQVSWPWLARVKHLFLTDANYKDKLAGYNPMMVVAVVIGLIQIFFGMAVNSAKIIKQHGLKYALAPIAWIVGLLGTAACFGLPMLGVAIPVTVNYIFYALIGISLVLIVFYNSPDGYKHPVGGVFKNIGSALWATYNMATGLLGDTLSYIRLFALGLTSGILGGAFNQLAFQFRDMIPVPGLDWLVFLFILLFGHSLNFALNAIGAFVHPLRLTFVEFYKNAGFEGCGEAYTPFEKLSTEK